MAMAMGRLSTAQCTLEMSQLDKREGVKRLCKSVTQLYAQLQETQKAERRFVGNEKHNKAGLDHHLHGVMLQNQKLEQKLSLATKAYKQNEKLELGLEELQELYGRSQAEEKSEAEAAIMYEKRYEEAQKTLDGATKLIQQSSQRDAERRQAEGELRKDLSVEHRKLMALQKKASTDTIVMKNEVGKLRKEVTDSHHLRQSLVLAQRSSHEDSGQLTAANQELADLKAEMLKMKSMLVETTTSSAAAEAKVADLTKELGATKKSLTKSNNRVATLEHEAKSLQQRDELACEKRVQQAYDECESKV